MPELKPTGHKTFDQIAAKDYIGTGNVYSNVQLSRYIRAFKNVDCNGFPWKEGELQKYDLKSFANPRYRIPGYIVHFVENVAVEDDVILYMFYHRNPHKEIVIHGYAVTKGHKQGHELLDSWVTGPTYKSRKILAECVKAISGTA
jgi:hypothetical protein